MLSRMVVLGVIFLFAGTGFGEGDGKVSMDQWIKIIESKDVKKAPPRKKTGSKNELGQRQPSCDQCNFR